MAHVIDLTNQSGNMLTRIIVDDNPKKIEYRTKRFSDRCNRITQRLRRCSNSRTWFLQLQKEAEKAVADLFKCDTSLLFRKHGALESDSDGKLYFQAVMDAITKAMNSNTFWDENAVTTVAVNFREEK